MSKIIEKAMSIAAKYDRLEIDKSKNDVTSSMEDMLLQLDKIETIDNEGLVDFLFSVGDVFLGVANNFKSLLTKLGRDSEMKKFSDRHVLKITSVENYNYLDVARTKVDIPTGAKGRYVDFVKQIGNNYDVVNVTDLVDASSSTLDSIITAISRETGDHDVVLKKGNSILEKNLKLSLSEFSKANKTFTASGMGGEQKEYGKLFKSVPEMKECRLSLISYEDHVRNVSKLMDKVDNINASVEDLISMIKSAGTSEANFKPSKAFVKSLANFVRNNLTLIENYAINIERQLAVEHNLVLVYNRLFQYI